MSKCNVKILNDTIGCRRIRSCHSLHYNNYYKQKVTEVNCLKCGYMAFYHDGEIIDENNIEIREEKEHEESILWESEKRDYEDKCIDLIEDEKEKVIFSGTGELLI